MICTVRDAQGRISTVDVPTREEIESLVVGGRALDCFGEMREVTRIFALGYTPAGKRFVCYYTQMSSTSECSMGLTEGEIPRSVFLTSRYTSAQIDALQRQIV